MNLILRRLYYEWLLWWFSNHINSYVRLISNSKWLVALIFIWLGISIRFLDYDHKYRFSNQSKQFHIRLVQNDAHKMSIFFSYLLWFLLKMIEKFYDWLEMFYERTGRMRMVLLLYHHLRNISFKDIQIDRRKNLDGTALRVKIYCCGMKRIR